jgi:hypothetical protein
MFLVLYIIGIILIVIGLLSGLVIFIKAMFKMAEIDEDPRLLGLFFGALTVGGILLGISKVFQ